MRVDPATSRLFIDFNYYCHLFGLINFRQFVILWYAADAVLQYYPPPAYVRYHIPDLHITTTAPHITLIRRTLQNGFARDGASQGVDRDSGSVN